MRPLQLHYFYKFASTALAPSFINNSSHTFLIFVKLIFKFSNISEFYLQLNIHYHLKIY